jgi:acetyl-CoA carboxylase biotin carboxyl carrier protein
LSEKTTHKKTTPRGKAAVASIASGPMDLGLLEKLVKLMADNGLSTVELTDGDQRITLKRGGETVTLPPSMGYSFPAAGPSHPAAVSPTSATEGSALAAADDESKLVPVKSPMPGTFYASPAKGAKPFVTVGAKVEEETDVCIVEAMKVFNTIKAECRGVIAKILVQDSQPVEFGQVLFLVKPG